MQQPASDYFLAETLAGCEGKKPMQNSIQNCALMGNDGAHFLHVARTTANGFRSHAVQTRNKVLALRFYEAALNITEPSIAAVKGTFTIECICDDAEFDAALAGVFRA